MCVFGNAASCNLMSLYSAASGSVDEALCFLEKWVRDAAERNQALGETLVPIIEHVISYNL